MNRKHSSSDEHYLTNLNEYGNKLGIAITKVESVQRFKFSTEEITNQFQLGKTYTENDRKIIMHGGDSYTFLFKRNATLYLSDRKCFSYMKEAR